LDSFVDRLLPAVIILQSHELANKHLKSVLTARVPFYLLSLKQQQGSFVSSFFQTFQLSHPWMQQRRVVFSDSSGGLMVELALVVVVVVVDLVELVVTIAEEDAGRCFCWFCFFMVALTNVRI
jgi:hypothetical protein